MTSLKAHQDAAVSSITQHLRNLEVLQMGLAERINEAERLVEEVKATNHIISVGMAISSKLDWSLFGSSDMDTMQQNIARNQGQMAEMTGWWQSAVCSEPETDKSENLSVNGDNMAGGMPCLEDSSGRKKGPVTPIFYVSGTDNQTAVVSTMENTISEAHSHDSVEKVPSSTLASGKDTSGQDPLLDSSCQHTSSHSEVFASCFLPLGQFTPEIEAELLAIMHDLLQMYREGLELQGGRSVSLDPSISEVSVGEEKSSKKRSFSRRHFPGRGFLRRKTQKKHQGSVLKLARIFGSIRKKSGQMKRAFRIG